MARHTSGLRIMFAIVACLILYTSRTEVAVASEPGSIANGTSSPLNASQREIVDVARASIFRSKAPRRLLSGQPPSIFLVNLAKGSFTSATGGVPEIDNVTSVVDVPGVTNGWTLQLNTNTFSTPACNGINSCGWVQFVYDSGGGVNIQAWLLGYLSTFTTCPANFQPGGRTNAAGKSIDCVEEPQFNSVPIVPFEKISGATLLASVDGSGHYTVQLVVGGQSFPKQPLTLTDTTLGLAGNWNSIQFNVYGECCGAQAVFNPGSLVKVTVSAATSAKSSIPTCDGAAGGTTAETSNLILIPTCQSSGGAAPVFSFLEGTPPVLSDILPPVGPPAGGNNVVINGTGFTTATVANFGGRAVACERSGSSSPNIQAGECQIASPGGRVGGIQVTAANVSAGGAAGPSSAPLSYTYVAACVATNSCPTPSCGKCGVGLHCCVTGAGQGGSPGHICVPLKQACPIIQ